MKSKIQGRRWYKRYREIADLLVEARCSNQTIVSVMLKVHDTIDDARGFGYAHLESSARESLHQVLADIQQEEREKYDL